MSQEEQVQQIKRIIEPLLVDDIFLVAIKIKPTNNIKVYIDADNGLPIEKCIKINRALYKLIEDLSIYPDGDFSLEVSSPGVNEPLKLLRQYKKNIGRDVELTLSNEEKIVGKLLAASENTITLEITEGKGKKAIKKETGIGYNDIKQATVQIKFN